MKNEDAYFDNPETLLAAANFISVRDATPPCKAEPRRRRNELIETQRERLLKLTSVRMAYGS